MKPTATLEWDYDCTFDEFLDEYILDEIRSEIIDMDVSEESIKHALAMVDKVKMHIKSYLAKGRWIDIDSQTYMWECRCSKCGYTRSMISRQGRYPRFCENCGADMRESE